MHEEVNTFELVFADFYRYLLDLGVSEEVFCENYGPKAALDCCHDAMINLRGFVEKWTSIDSRVLRNFKIALGKDEPDKLLARLEKSETLVLAAQLNISM